MKHKRSKSNKRKKQLSSEMNAPEIIEQDETFYYIAGYTSGGAPYGVTWEEMGLEPFEDETDEFPFDDV